MAKTYRRYDDDDLANHRPDNGRPVLGDRQGLRVPMLMMDAHRPGPRTSTAYDGAPPDPDAAQARADAYDQMTRQLCDAWRGPQRDATFKTGMRPADESMGTDKPDEDDDEPDDDQTDQRDAALEAHRTYLENAWKGPGAAASAVEAARRKVTAEE